MDSSEPDDVDQQPKKRVKREKFKGLRKRIALINVDGYKSLARVDAKPFGDADSFFQERLNHWTEMDVTSNFKDLASRLAPIAGSLAQVVHHKDEIFQTVLEQCNVQASASIQAIGELVAGLARDIQEMFIPFLANAVAKIADLIDKVCHSPEPLKMAIGSLANIFQSLSKILTNKIPWVLQLTKPLRTHRVPHIRKLAAQTVAFLFRQASVKKLKLGIKCLMAESCTKKSQEQTIDGVGQTVASICYGIQGKLNSLAESVLETALDAQLLCLEEFKTMNKGKRPRERELEQSFAPSWLSMNVIRSRCSESCSRALEILMSCLKHGEGQCLVLSTIMRESNILMNRYLQAEKLNGMLDENVKQMCDSACEDLGRCSSLVATVVEGMKRNKDVDLAAPMAFASKLTEISLSRSKNSSKIYRGNQVVKPVQILDTRFMSLAGQVLDLQSALVTALVERKATHILEESIQPWSRIWSVVSPSHIFSFSRKLLAIDNTILLLVASHLLASLCEVVRQHQLTPDVPEAVEALLLVCEVARAYRSKSGMLVPRLMVGTKDIVAHVVELLRKWECLPSKPFSKSDVAIAWLGLRCLPELAAKTSAVAEACKKLVCTIEQIFADNLPDTYIHEDVDPKYLLLIQSKAKGMIGQIFCVHSKVEFVQSTADAVEWFQNHPQDYCVLETVAELLSLMRHTMDQGDLEAGTDLMKAPTLEDMLPTICPLLSNPSQNVRKASLRIICSFEPPILKEVDEPAEKISFCDNRCRVFESILEIEKEPMSLKNEQRAQALADTVKSWIEGSRIPDVYIYPIISALMGLLYIRFSRLWGPVTQALGVAAQKHPEEVWSLFFPAIVSSQARLMNGKQAPVATEQLNMFDLMHRMDSDFNSGGVEASGGCTDPLTCLSHVFQAIVHTKSALLRTTSLQWVDVFLEFVARRPGTSTWQKLTNTEDAVMSPGSCSLTEWKKGLVAWLSAIELAPQPRTYHRSTEILTSLGGLLSEDAKDVQLHVLACMKNFKVPIVGQYISQFSSLTDLKTMKDELLRFPINEESEAPVPDAHRAVVIQMLTSILHPKFQRPKMRKVKGLHMWILRFLEGFRDEELRHFLGKVLLDFHTVFDEEKIIVKVENTMIEDVVDIEKGLLLPEPQWVKDLDRFSGSDWLGKINVQVLKEISVKAMAKVLAKLTTLFTQLGYRLCRFLNPVLALLTHVLQEITAKNTLDDFPEKESKGFKDKQPEDINDDSFEDMPEGDYVKLSSLQRHCLRLITKLWTMLPDRWDHSLFIEKVLAVVEPWMCELSNSNGAVHNQTMLLDLAGAISLDFSLSAFMAPAADHCKSAKETCVGGSRLGNVLLSQVVAFIACHDSSRASHDSALSVIENLLDHGDAIVNTVLLPHVPSLLKALKEYIVALSDGKVAEQSSGNTARFRMDATREFLILEQIANLGVDAESARTVAYALFPLLKSLKNNRKIGAHVHMTVQILNCITAVWNRVGALPDDIFSEEETKRFCSELAPQASHLQSKESRFALAKSFNALCAIDKSIEPIANLFADLNSFAEGLSGDFDYDRRLTGYTVLTFDYWKHIQPHAVSPLLHTCLFDLENPDYLSIRQAASDSLSRLIEALIDAVEDDQPHTTIVHVYKLLLRNVGTANLSVRQEHLARVRQILLAYPSICPGLAKLAILDDEEHDFFCCVSHLQLHRRARAWVMLSKQIDTDDNLPTKESMDVILPLILQAIFDGRTAETSGRRVASELETSRESGVVEATATVLSRLSSRLPWNLYRKLLNEIWSSVDRANSPGKAMIKALCAVVDALSFPITDPQHPDGQETDEANDKAVKGCLPIARHMLERVLPKLKKLLMDDEGKARPPVALSLVKLLKKAPKKYEQSELHGSLLRVANLLKHRWQGVRDDARTVFVGMARELGSKYLDLLIMVLQSSLLSKGYAIHVLGYTVHAVLDALATTTEAGDTDQIVQSVLPIIDAELFGEVADAKEAKQFTANYREAKTCKACETCYLLVQHATFDACAAEFIRFVRDRLPLCPNPKLRHRLSDLLRHFSNGMLDNKSATMEELFSFIYDLVDEGMSKEEKAIAASESAAGMAGSSAKSLLQAGKPSISDRYEPLMVEFAIKILLTGLKKGRMDVRKVEVLGLLDPILPLLIRCLKSRHAPVSSQALKCVCLMVRLPLPSLSKTADAAGNTVMMMLDKVGSSSDPVAQDCFNFLAKILQEGKSFNPTNDQVNSLLILIQGDLEEHSHRHTGFSLFKAMIDRQIMVPGIYDMMNKVQKLMVMSQAGSVRQASSALLLKFLLTYPLGEARLIDHLNFVLKNISYEFEAGRLQVIDLLQAMMRKFPVELLEVQAELFFLPMVVGLANDESKSCREELAKAIECLVERVGSSSSSALIALVMRWLNSQDKKLRRTAAQAMGILAKAKPKLVNETELLQALTSMLSRHSQLVSLGLDCKPSAVGPEGLEWLEAYSALVLLEKLIEHLKMKSKFLQSLSEENGYPAYIEIWEHVVTLLKYEHLWVRKSALRLVMQGLAVVGDDLVGKNVDLAFGRFDIRKLSFLLFSALNAGAIDIELVALASKALVWIAPALHAVSSLDSCEADVQGASSSEELQMAGLVLKMTKLADDRSVGQMGVRLAALKFLAALTSRLGAEAVGMYLDIIMVPLFRILESSKGLDPPEVTTTAEEIQSYVKQVVGGDAMLASLNRARHEVQDKRLHRKKKDKLQKINNPEAAAQRRVKKNRIRLESRKRDREYRKIARPNVKKRK